MRTILTVFLIIAFNFSAFAQIDSSAWERTTIWHKTYVFANCQGRIEDCLVWRLVEKINIRDSVNGEIDEYIFINESSQTFIDSLPYLYQNDSLNPNESKWIFVDLIRSQHPKLEKILIEKYGDSHNIFFMTEFAIHGKPLPKELLFVLSDGTNQMRIIDLNTNRLIENIKIE